MSAETRKFPRLFLALWPEEAVRGRLRVVLREVREAAEGRWVRPENLHITLAFLGDVAEDRVDSVTEIARGIEVPAFTLVLDRIECWPRKGVLYLAPAATPPELKNLAEGLAVRLAEAGFTLEQRSYRAHLTLARKARATSRLHMLDDFVVWSVRSFCLVESRLHSGGAEYRVRNRFALQGHKAIP
jgi:2'-5' RNA ligase